jgi:hypothetical protein
MNTTTISLAAFALLGALAAGCGSGGNGNRDGAAGNGNPTGSSLSWKENGTAHSALFPSAALARSATLDLLEIAGAETTLGLAFGIGVKPPPIVAGSYACGGAAYPIVSFAYGQDGVSMTCTLDLTSVGLDADGRAVGTFSASISVTGGGTKSITEGKFDLALTVSSL